MSEAILAHGGEALESRESFAGLSTEDQAAVIEFLKTLQLPPEGDGGLIGGGIFGAPVVWTALGGGVAGAAVTLGCVLAFAWMRKRRGD